MKNNYTILKNENQKNLQKTNILTPKYSGC